MGSISCGELSRKSLVNPRSLAEPVIAFMPEARTVAMRWFQISGMPNFAAVLQSTSRSMREGAWRASHMPRAAKVCTVNPRPSTMLATALAPTGAWMTFIALWTGALWGKPTWGTWWVWDARLTSELVLLFLYIGYMSLHAAIEDARRADRSAALLAIVGVVNVPIIYFSVQWWNTLHQGASISLTKAPSMAPPMLIGMLVMSLAFWAYCIAVALVRVRIVILERERHTQWARKVVTA